VSSTPAPAPLTRQLSKSFGNSHDVVQATAFIVSVTGGTVTLTQLEAHLEQRALVHETIDQVLGASTVKPLPYGPAQREVLTLLHDNLRDLGRPWPTASAAFPLTQKMVDEIHDSASKGPYFALGVFHVYYGGITHGGRDIGQMIDKALKTNLTYYGKSDGYEDYAKEVNTITDPDAQKEMIRGGVEAYKYLIAVNNADVFKPAK
jgi:hypothetical protein